MNINVVLQRGWCFKENCDTDDKSTAFFMPFLNKIPFIQNSLHQKIFCCGSLHEGDEGVHKKE